MKTNKILIAGDVDIYLNSLRKNNLAHTAFSRSSKLSSGHLSRRGINAMPHILCGIFTVGCRQDNQAYLLENKLRSQDAPRPVRVLAERN